MDPWTVIASFFFTKYFLPVACLQCPLPGPISRVSTLGQPGQGTFALSMDPNRGVLSDCSAQLGALGACLFRVPCAGTVLSLHQHNTYRRDVRTRCRLPRCCGQLVVCVCTMARAWNGGRERWGSPLTGSSSRQYGLLIRDTSLSARLIRHRSNPAAA